MPLGQGDSRWIERAADAVAEELRPFVPERERQLRVARRVIELCGLPQHFRAMREVDEGSWSHEGVAREIERYLTDA